MMTAPIADAVPLQPPGYRLLVRPFQPPRQTAGGIILPEESVRYEEILCTVAQVVAMGESCYAHPKFDDARWCEVGTWILHAKHVGYAIEVKTDDPDQPVIKYRVINDDDVLAITVHPEAIRSYVA